MKLTIAVLCLAVGAFALLLTNSDTMRNQAAVVLLGATTQADRVSCLQAHNLAENVDSVAFSTLDLDTTKPKDIVMRIEDDRHCGNTGCRYELCTVNKEGVEALTFGYAGVAIETREVVSDGYRNVILTTKDDEIFLEWDGNYYSLIK